MISIIIPLFDKAPTVWDTLESIRKQVFTAYEVIIVDDASTDGSMEMVHDYLRAHPSFAAQVRLFSQSHAGVSAARNKAIAESRYDWIAFLDADDTWSPEYLQTQYTLSLRYPSCEVLAAAYEFRRSGGRLTPARFNKLPFKGMDGIIENYFEVAACSHPPMSSIMTMVRKQAVLSIGGFPVGVSSGEDLLTWARLALRYRIVFNKKVMGIYNQDPSRFNNDQHTRMPARTVQDVVGKCLEDLLYHYPDTPGLKDYLGLWHKMRTRIYLTNSMRKEAWTEWLQLVRFSPVHYKTWAYLVLLISPVKAFD